MVFARLMVTVLVPCAMVLILDDWCFGLWSQFWQPCQEPGRFDVDLDVTLNISRPFIDGYYGKNDTNHTRYYTAKEYSLASTIPVT